MNQQPMNERRFSHTSRGGTRFDCARCDFKGPIIVTIHPSRALDDATLLLRDTAEMIGYHAAVIRPELFGGFSGYDTLKFVDPILLEKVAANLAGILAPPHHARETSSDLGMRIPPPGAGGEFDTTVHAVIGLVHVGPEMQIGLYRVRIEDDGGYRIHDAE